jgi:hypothetical protein
MCKKIIKIIKKIHITIPCAIIIYFSSVFYNWWWLLEIGSIILLIVWIFFYGNTSLKNLAFIDSILVLRWISSILDLCTRNRYALLLYTYATNTQSTVLYHILTFLRSSISTFTRHPHTLRYMLEGLLPLHNLYGVFSNFVRSTLLSI